MSKVVIEVKTEFGDLIFSMTVPLTVAGGLMEQIGREVRQAGIVYSSIPSKEIPKDKPHT